MCGEKMSNLDAEFWGPFGGLLGDDRSVKGSYTEEMVMYSGKKYTGKRSRDIHLPTSEEDAYIVAFVYSTKNL